MSKQESPDLPPASEQQPAPETKPERPPEEYGGPRGKEPTRYGDWEKNGRCIDF